VHEPVDELPFAAGGRGRLEDADRVERAVTRVLERGHRTRDIAESGRKTVGTREMADLIVGAVEAQY